jgi:addiction module HigA family antidote
MAMNCHFGAIKAPAFPFTVQRYSLGEMAEDPDMKISAPPNRMRPVHPGEILREDYLKPLGLSANALAQALKVPASRINDIVLERRGITVDTAMRLVRYFGGDVQSWMNLQTAYEIKVAEQTLAKKIRDEVQPLAA